MRKTTLLLSTLMLAACGGGSSGNNANPVVMPSPTPTVSPTPSPTPVSATVARLKSVLADGGAPEVAAASLSLDVQQDVSYLPDSTLIEPDDVRIRSIGGRHTRGATFPRTLFMYPQAITVRTPQPDAGGYATQRRGIVTGAEFVLPASHDRFEAKIFDGGLPGNIFIEIEGKRTNADGYPSGYTGTGRFLHTLITLPDSATDRVVRIWTPGRPFGGLRLPDDGDIGMLAPAAFEGASVVFIGDSITEGTGASHPLKGWAVEAAYRIGFSDPIVSAIGGTGYIQRRGDDFNFGDRSGDVLEAIDGGPPDMVVVAGGINDCGRHTPEAIGDAAQAYFETLRAGAPDMPIVVIGPFSRYEGVPYGPQLQACRDAIFAAAGTVSSTYTVDVADWLTLENRDEAFNQAIDPVHPVDAGHRIYAERAAQAIRAIITGL